MGNVSEATLTLADWRRVYFWEAKGTMMFVVFVTVNRIKGSLVCLAVQPAGLR